MALEDRDIFTAIYERFADQPIEFIMEQYEKAKRMNIEIERRLGQVLTTPQQEAEPEAVIEATEEVIEQPIPQQKKYTRRNLKVKPQNSITDDAIICCICGEARQNLTARHLAQHGLTVEEYKKLCGYAPNQPLMSGKRLAKSREIISRAQQARLDKKAAESRYE